MLLFRFFVFLLPLFLFGFCRVGVSQAILKGLCLMFKVVVVVPWCTSWMFTLRGQPRSYPVLGMQPSTHCLRGIVCKRTQRAGNPSSTNALSCFTCWVSETGVG